MIFLSLGLAFRKLLNNSYAEPSKDRYVYSSSSQFPLDVGPYIEKEEDCRDLEWFARARVNGIERDINFGYIGASAYMERRNDESGQRRVVKAACSQLQQFWDALGFRKEKAWFNSRWLNALRTAAEVVVSEHTMVLVRVWSRDSWFRRSRYRRQIKTAIEFRSSNGRNLKIWSIISSLIWWFHCSSRCLWRPRVASESSAILSSAFRFVAMIWFDDRRARKL